MDGFIKDNIVQGFSMDTVNFSITINSSIKVVSNMAIFTDTENYTIVSLFVS